MTASNLSRATLSPAALSPAALSPAALCRAALTFAGLVALAGASACHKDKPPPAETKTEAKPAPSTPEPRRPQRAAAVDEGVEVPTEEDFEDAVEKQLTSSSNLQKELDQLEKQIQQPPQ